MAYPRLDAILNPPDPHGIYLGSRPVRGSKGLFRHEVIVDARWFRPRPVVYEQTEEGFRRVALRDAGLLTITAKAPDTDVAGHRLRLVAERPPAYNALTDNCQHVARDVVLGRHESPDVRGVVALALGAAAIAALSPRPRRRAKPKRRRRRA
jgi:hypothetical protein